MVNALFSYWHYWWSRAAGGKEIASTAIPMIISAGSIALMQFVDRVFLTWYDDLAMGASFSSGMIFFSFMAFPFSVAGYVNAFVAQYYGAKKYHRLCDFVWQGIWIGLLFMPILLGISSVIDHLFHFFKHTPGMVSLETTYFYYSAWGSGAMIASESLAAFFSGRQKMKTVMLVNLFAVFLNIVLDYYLIFGFMGHCRWGIAGAALATTIAQWIRFFLFLVLMFWEDARQKCYHVWQRCRFQKESMLRLLKFGGMGGLQYVVEMIGFSVFVLIIGMVGELENSATAIAFNLNSFIFMPLAGTGIAVMTRVGNYLGENRPQLARRTTITACVFGSVIAGTFAFLFLFFPNLFLSIYAKNCPTDFEPLRQLTTNILRFLACYLFFDMLNIIFFSAIKGAGDTRFAMILTLCMQPFLLVPTWIGLGYFHLGIYWCWSVLTLWVMLFCIASTLRFLHGKWLTKRLFNVESSNLV